MLKGEKIPEISLQVATQRYEGEDTWDTHTHTVLMVWFSKEKILTLYPKWPTLLCATVRQVNLIFLGQKKTMIQHKEIFIWPQ